MEGAVASSDKDATARHALGLAYAQLKRYEDAYTTLQTALELAPDNPHIREDLKLVERRLARKPMTTSQQT